MPEDRGHERSTCSRALPRRAYSTELPEAAKTNVFPGQTCSQNFDRRLNCRYAFQVAVPDASRERKSRQSWQPSVQEPSERPLAKWSLERPLNHTSLTKPHSHQVTITIPKHQQDTEKELFEKHQPKVEDQEPYTRQSCSTWPSAQPHSQP